MSPLDDALEAAARQVEHFCAARTPENPRDQMRLEHEASGSRAASDVGPLLAEIEADPDGVFFG